MRTQHCVLQALDSKCMAGLIVTISENPDSTKKLKNNLNPWASTQKEAKSKSLETCEEKKIVK